MHAPEEGAAAARRAVGATNGGSQVSECDHLIVRQAIEALNAAFAWDVDHRWGEGVPELFVEDGVYAAPGLELRGRGEIARFYAERRARGKRTSRHVFTNLHLFEVRPGSARGTTLLTLHAHDGEGPLPASPSAVMDYEDEYVRGADGQWRYVRRNVVPVFGEVPKLVAQQNQKPVGGDQ